MKKKILIADDQVESRTLIRLYLTKAGYDVIEAANGQDALARIAKEKPDLVILDVIMPILDGASVAIELSKAPETQNIPIIISTTRGTLKDLFSVSQAAKISDFIEKPFKPEELVSKVTKIIGV